ncbi:MAG TPA: GntR family transcriptional regulator [Actinomycetota bacterium]|nr:GntR family transcriptional regulator [Actinomycetota bacterium]
MILELEPDSPVPPYEQIRAQVATMAAAGVIPAGMRLPSIRQLAKDLRVAVGTVARAYRELELAGVIATRGRHGTFVNDIAPDAGTPVGEDGIADAARTFAVRARQLGVDSEHALEVARHAFDSMPAG